MAVKFSAGLTHGDNGSLAAAPKHRGTSTLVTDDVDAPEVDAVKAAAPPSTVSVSASPSGHRATCDAMPWAAGIIETAL
jgi:hypothetical protein